MEHYASVITFLFVCVSIWAFAIWRKYTDTKKLKEWVSWSVCESDGARWNIPLWAHIKDAQLHTNISDKYRISGEEEWEAAKEVIEKYRKSLLQSYHSNQLWALKNTGVWAINGKDYFIFMLYVYLCEHDRYAKEIVALKMQYITYMYCKGHPGLQKRVPAWNEGRLTEILDSHLPKAQPEPNRMPSLDSPGVKINYRGRP
jgi:hypothetical protein